LHQAEDIAGIAAHDVEKIQINVDLEKYGF